MIRIGRTHAALAIAAASAFSAALVVVPAPAYASGTIATLQSSTKRTVVRGVQRWSISWTNTSGFQRGYLMSVNLNRLKLHVQPGMANGTLNERATVLRTARRLGAVGGINGDVFSWSTSMPTGSVG